MNEILQGQQETFVLQARAIGKITRYVETSLERGHKLSLRRALEVARSRVAVLELELDPKPHGKGSIPSLILLAATCRTIPVVSILNIVVANYT